MGSKSLLVKSMRWRAVRQGCGPLSGPLQVVETLARSKQATALFADVVHSTDSAVAVGAAAR
ncbi:MAG: hypothetical protein JOZ49_08980 [Mycolicibacterium sp.]|nr:hypothetical protein [Mycolicibacterium sp.]